MGMVHIDISGLALWFIREKAYDMVWPTDYPRPISPWAEAIYYFSAPMLLEGGVVDGIHGTVPIHDFATNIEVNSFLSDYRPDNDGTQKALDALGVPDEQRKHINEQARFGQREEVYFIFPGRARSLIGRSYVLLDSTGEVIASYIQHNAAIPESQNLSISGYAEVVAFANCLAHCRNVEVRDRPVSRQQRRMAERQGRPVTVYKELVIDAFRKQVRYETQEDGGNEIKRALHICRGHFATYGDDNPLFGKHTGTFWRPMHVRGHTEVGEVKKSYKVEGAK